MGKNDLMLSKEHGVNPSVMICPACGKETGVALLGHNRGEKAPRYIMDRSLCAECKKIIDHGGVILIEVEDGQGGDGTRKNPVRTGKIVGIKRTALDPQAIGTSEMAYVEQSQLMAMMGATYDKNIDNTASVYGDSSVAPAESEEN